MNTLYVGPGNLNFKQASWMILIKLKLENTTQLPISLAFSLFLRYVHIISISGSLNVQFSQSGMLNFPSCSEMNF